MEDDTEIQEEQNEIAPLSFNENANLKSLKKIGQEKIEKITKKSLIRGLEKISGLSHFPMYRVFEDFCTVCSCSLHNAFMKVPAMARSYYK